MKPMLYLSAAAVLALGLAGPVSAQDSQEPDCPEDFDTEPGCDMSPMDGGGAETETSESQPVEGAATAPTAEGDGEGSKTIEGPDADPASEPSSGETGSDSDASGSEGSGDDATESDTSGSDASDDGAGDGAAEGGASEEDEASSGAGQTVEVAARGVKFEPAIVFVEPGDTVSWVNMPSHNVETIEGMVPEGQEEINSELGENISRSFDTEGIVVYKCTPHWGNRMGGIIVVGDPENPMETIDAYMESANENTENLPALGLLKDLRAEMEAQG